MNSELELPAEKENVQSFRNIRRFIKIIDWTNTQIAKIGFVLLIGLMILVPFEVLMRYVFNHPTIWSMEINQFMLATLFALGGGFLLLVNGHINVDIIYGRFSPRTKAIISLVTSSLIFLSLVLFLWKTGEDALQSYQYLETTGSSFNPPIWPVKIIFPIGIFLILMQSISRFIKFLIQAITGVEEIKEHTDILGRISQE